MREAIIDIGSNTIRLSVYEVDADSHAFKQVVNRKIAAGLASYIEDGCISDRGIKKAQDSIADQLRRTGGLDVDGTRLFATAVLRNAANGAAAVDQIEQALGVHIEVLPGEEEARLGFIGAMHSFEGAAGVSLDVGGASSELVAFRDAKPYLLTSLPMGSLSLFMDHTSYLLPTKAEQKSIAATVEKALCGIDGLQGVRSKTLLGIGGAARSIGKLADDIYNNGRKTRQVSAVQMKEMLARFSDGSREQILELLQVIPDRVHTVLPGMACIYAVMKHIHADEMVVSRYGVREGYLCTRVIGDYDA